MHRAASSALSPFDWVIRWDEENNLAASPCKTFRLEVSGVSLWPFGVKPQSHAPHQPSLFSHVWASHQRGTPAGTPLPMGGLNSHSCAQSSWAHNANEAVWNQSGRCLPAETPEAGCCWQVSVCPFLSSRLFAPALQRLSASTQLSCPGSRSCHHLCPPPGTAGIWVLPLTAQEIKRFWHQHRQSQQHKNETVPGDWFSHPNLL